MAKKRRIRWDRVAIVFGPLLLLLLIIWVGCSHKEPSVSDEADLHSVTTVTTETTAPTETQPVEIPVEAVKKNPIICIDAGHGGYDGGATDEEEIRYEKDDNLHLALAVRDAFRERYPDVEIIMTRETDVFIELQERCNIANNANADFFISLHRNSSTSGKGVEIWINNESVGDNKWDKLLAEYIMDWLDQVGISERRGIQTGFRNNEKNVESNNYVVNRYTNMPSCLIEMGFMTSDEDNRYFDDNLDDYADAIVSAVMELMADKDIYPTTTLQ